MSVDEGPREGAAVPEQTQPESASAPAPATGEGASAPPPVSKTRRRLKKAAAALAVVVVVWLTLAYVILPVVWRHYEHHPAMEDAPKTTVTAQGIPGDPLNVGLIGTEEEILQAMHVSGWDPADPVTARSSLKIAKSVLLDRPYVDAPVSPLYVFGRKQDLAFEKPVGDNASRRHHVRFWRSNELGHDGVPLWIGAVTFDKSVGLSHRTGQITHHIAPDVDSERDGLMDDLMRNGWLIQLYQVTGVGSTLLGRNGGGDPYYTDGELSIGELARAPDPARVMDRLENPPVVQIKDQFWSAVRPLLQSLPQPE